MVYAAVIVLLGLAVLICQWVKKAWEWLWGRLKKGTARIKGRLLITASYWYGVQDQSGEKRKTVVVDRRVPELELFDCGKLLAGEKTDENEWPIGSDKTLVEGASLWAHTCGIAARSLHLLRNIRTPGMKEIDVEKNAIEPMSRQSHLIAHLRLLKEHPPCILPAVWKRQRTQHSASKIGQELVPTVVPLPSAKKGSMPSSDSLDKMDMKEGFISSDRTLTKRPSMWRRLGSFVASFRPPQSLPSHEEDLEKDFEKDLKNHKKRVVSSLSPSSTMVGSENEKSSKMDILKPPESVYTPTIKR